VDPGSLRHHQPHTSRVPVHTRVCPCLRPLYTTAMATITTKRGETIRAGELRERILRLFDEHHLKGREVWEPGWSRRRVAEEARCGLSWVNKVLTSERRQRPPRVDWA